MKPERKFAPDTGIVAFLTSLDSVDRRRAVELLGPQDLDTLDRAWNEWAHDGQVTPVGDWSTWVIKAGRGFGKTRAGAEWITARIAEGGPLRIALVGATLDDARRVMVEGRSGLLEVAGAWVTDWHASLGRLRFRTGAEAVLFTGHTPHLLRGPEHHYAWCDELAKWERPRESWDILQLGLRLGANPQTVVTTPRAPARCWRASWRRKAPSSPAVRPAPTRTCRRAGRTASTAFTPAPASAARSWAASCSPTPPARCGRWS